MSRRLAFFSKTILLATLTISLIALNSGTLAHNPTDRRGDYEVWIMDQSDTRPDGGGTLYIFDGKDLEGHHADEAEPKVIDLGAEARDFCIEHTGTAPRRPHMMFFNKHHTHAIISFVATGHVLIMSTKKRQLVGVIDVGVQAHAAVPSPDDRFLIVADQNGKKLHRITTDYENDVFTHDTAATIDLATCTTPNGVPCENAAIRPDNAPVCPDFDATGRFVFVTLRGGGLFVVDTQASPMAIVAEYDKDTVRSNGCGGVHANGKIYIDAGGGTPANPLVSELYSFPLDAISSTPGPPNTPAPNLIFNRGNLGFVDSHGMVLTKKNRYLWVADRAANRIVAVETETDQVVNEIDLVGPSTLDPAPDLLDRSPTGHRVFMAFRGPNPLTGNSPGVNNAVGATPGLGIVRVRQGGRDGVLDAIVPISRIVDGVERADPHGIAVRVK